MKTKIISIFLILAASVETMFAEKVKIGDLYYNLDAYSQTAEVTSQNSNSYPYWSTTITIANIPSSVTYNSVPYSVTSIGDGAFDGCTGLTSVTIPNSITSIGYQTFYGCASLTSVTIPNSVTSIGEYAFSYCSGLTSVTIPNSVTSIGERAFASCSSMISIDIADSNPNYCSVEGVIFNKEKSTLIQYPGGKQGDYIIPTSVTSIGNSAFYDCTGLTSVTIPNSVTSIGDRAFFGCTGLASVTIPNSVTSIGSSAFYNCTGLTSITNKALIPQATVSSVFSSSILSECVLYVPEGSLTLYQNAPIWNTFAHIVPIELTSGTCGPNLTWNLTDGILTISGTGEMTDFSYPDYGPWYSLSSSITSVVINDGVTSIGKSAFSGCTGLTSVTIGNSVTSIGESAFSGCTGLTSVNIPNSVTSIGSYAFLNVPNIFYNGTATGSPWGARSINGYVDGSLVYTDSTKTTLVLCFPSAIGEIIIPNSVTNIRDGAFKNAQITSVTIPGSVKHLGDATAVDKGNGVFASCTQLQTVNLQSGLQTIGYQSFYKCTNLTSINIPNTVTQIGHGAFAYTGLRSITIPGSVTCLGNGDLMNDDGTGAFGYCSQLETVVLNEGLKTISYETFENCTNLTTINIPNSVTAIGTNAFKNCTSLPVEGYIRYAGTYLVEVTDRTRTTYTIKEGTRSIGGSGRDYAGFKGCANMTSITIPNTVNYISDFAFDGCTSLPVINNIRYADTYLVEAVDKTLSTYTIKEGTKWIGTSAFDYCTALTSIVIPNTVISIGYEAFFGCSSLRSITLPNTISSIAAQTFYNCSSLPSIQIPSSITSIGSEAFLGCSNLTSIAIPEGVTRLETNLFYKCRKLSSVSLPESLISIGEQVFEYCDSLKSIRIPIAVKKIEEYAFDCENLSSVYISSLDAWCDIEFENNSSNPLYKAHNLYIGNEKISDLVIPNGVKAIKDNAFIGGTFNSVTIPNSVTNIGKKAFDYSDIGYILMESNTPPTLSSYSFKKNQRIYVPLGGALDVYRQSSEWINYDVQLFDLAKVFEGPRPTSFTLTFKATIGNKDVSSKISSCGIEEGEEFNGNVIEFIGLEPESQYNDVPLYIRTIGNDYDTIHYSFSTTALELTTKPSKPVSATTAILLAETNMSDAEVSCGFEYKRNDAPADMAGTKVFCPVANGQMAGRLKNLKDDVYYKYRAFYQSAAGNMYYGDWQYIFTGDVAVEFDPILYTYEATVVRENEATVSGYAFAGSDEFTEQGFEYWAESRVGSANVPSHMPAALNDHYYAQASGIRMSVTLNNLDAGTVYKYRTYAKVGDQYYYGSEHTFTTTGDYEGETTPIEEVPSDDIQEVKARKILLDGQIFILRGDKVYNAQGALVK